VSGIADLLTGILSSLTGRELALGRFVVDITSTAARTDVAAGDGEIHAYTSGSTIVVQIFDKDAGAWRAATFS
jgi:hypothetical protein